MGRVNIQHNKNFRDNANEKLEGLTGSDWLAFLDAVGRVEGNDRYDINNGVGYYGIYQQGEGVIDIDLKLFDNYGKDILDVSTMQAFQKNPIAQELAGLMEFSGEPDLTKPFSSKYTAVSHLPNILPRKHLEALMGKTFTVNWAKNGETLSNTFTVNKASISGAAHLIGQGGVAKALEAMYDKAFKDGRLVHSTIALDPNNIKFADGNHIAFSTYMELFDGYNVDKLISVNNRDDFTARYGELLAYRKDKITEYIATNGNMVLNNDEDYSKEIHETIANFTKANIEEKDIDKIVLAGKDTSTSSNKNDLIISLDNDVAKTLKGGKGDDVYVAHNHDTINDTDNQGKVYFDATLLSGIKHKVSENVYEDAMFTYTKEANNLHIAQKEDPSKSVTIEHWNSQTNQALGIELSETKEQTQANEQSAVTSAMIDSHTLQEAKQIEEEHYETTAQQKPLHFPN